MENQKKNQETTSITVQYKYIQNGRYEEVVDERDCYSPQFSDELNRLIYKYRDNIYDGVTDELIDTIDNSNVKIDTDKVVLLIRVKLDESKLDDIIDDKIGLLEFEYQFNNIMADIDTEEKQIKFLKNIMEEYSQLFRKARIE